ncbi:zinc finger CCCH domain-containing protein 11A-like isoform X2 [Harmonia axyridis]|nr:zinc finger CCCH domain-containing protein 11A-like isoform X2 [Harmonia axyridis]
MTDLDSPRRNNDCYFYYYSTCTKGDSCTFRHEPSALGCETMCSFWKEGKCLNVHCNYRHMELRKNRKAIQCYWETQPGGCLKPHCPFLHQNARQSMTNSHNNSEVTASSSNSTQNIEEVTQSPTQNDIGSQSSERNFRNQVDSLVVTFEEESDTESIPSRSPRKLPQKKVRVKTLEEIRLERIQEESAAYFAYSLDCPENDTVEDLRRNLIRKRKKDNEEYPLNLAKKLRLDNCSDNNTEIYLDSKMCNVFSKINNNEQEEMTQEQKKSVYANKGTLRDRKIKNNDLCSIQSRGIKRNTRGAKRKMESIKIKTLEEIRAEKMKKKESESTELVEEISSTTKDVVEEKTTETISVQPSPQKKKLKLVRLSSTDLKELVKNENGSTKDKEIEQVLQNDHTINESLPSLNSKMKEDHESCVPESNSIDDRSCRTKNEGEKIIGNEYEEEMLLMEDDLDYEDDGLMNEIDSILSK